MKVSDRNIFRCYSFNKLETIWLTEFVRVIFCNFKNRKIVSLRIDPEIKKYKSHRKFYYSIFNRNGIFVFQVVIVFCIGNVPERSNEI